MRALVTGGGGFLGGAIVKRLLAKGWKVRTLQRSAYPWLADAGVEQVRADLTHADAVKRSCQDCDVVFHVAAKAGVWGSYDSYHRPNVRGTEHILAGCAQYDVQRLIYTSSPSVTFDGRDQDGADESAPYPTRWLAHYPHTKALAEQKVLAINGEKLATVSLRPHLIWGPGDNHLVPRIVERAKAGKLKILGEGQKKVDSVYIDNAADAHILAADALEPGAPHAGKAYFITNSEPLPMADLINGILKAAGLPPVTARVSPGVAYLAGALMEAAGKLVGRKSEPVMTRFVARQLSTAHWFDISAAKRDFGYAPEVSMKEGFERLAVALAKSGQRTVRSG